MILKSGRREYGNDVGGFGAGILQADPCMLRNEHQSSRMQIALLISNMNVDGSFLDKHDLILLKMLVRWDGVARSHAFSGNDHHMLRTVGFGRDFEDESANVALARLRPSETRFAFVFFQQQRLCSSLRG